MFVPGKLSVRMVAPVRKFAAPVPPLARWITPVDCGPSGPGGCRSIRLMWAAQLGHCPTRARCSHALCRGTPTVNSRGVRLGSFVLVRDAIEDELELVFRGKKSAQAALDAAVERGNRLLRQFERANPDR